MNADSAPLFRVAAMLEVALKCFRSEHDTAWRCLAHASELVRTELSATGAASNNWRYKTGCLTPGKLARAVAYIESCMETGACVDEMAQVVRLSTSHFSRAFKASIGYSPAEYLQARRVAHAKHLMKTTANSLARVATDCGFSDQAHFCKVFRRHVGMSPRAWRYSEDPGRPASMLTASATAGDPSGLSKSPLAASEGTSLRLLKKSP